MIVLLHINPILHGRATSLPQSVFRMALIISLWTKMAAVLTLGWPADSCKENDIH